MNMITLPSVITSLDSSKKTEFNIHILKDLEEYDLFYKQGILMVDII